MARKILLADDSVTAQNMGRKILADAGYEVITVNNGSAALKRIGEQRPDVIVLDVYMPGYSGLEVCQRLKEVGDTSRIPILLTVGKLEPFKPEEAKRVRADGFIVKPFEASELLSALTRLEDKIVPRNEPSKPGRFARLAMEDGRYDKTMAVEEDTSWKNRISFPGKKKDKEKDSEPDEAAYSAPKDVRSVREQVASEAPSPQPLEHKVDLGALATTGLPKDVAPEEIAALAAAAARMKGKEDRLPEAASEMPVVAPTELPPIEETTPVSAPEELSSATPLSLSKIIEEKVEAEAEQDKAANIIPEVPAEAPVVTTALTPSSQDVAEVSSEPVTMAVVAAVGESTSRASRWTAVSVALAPEDEAITLEQEMQKAYSSFAAAESAHSSSITPESSHASNIPEVDGSVPATIAPEVIRPLSAVADAATEAVTAAVKELENVASAYVARQTDVVETSSSATSEPQSAPVLEAAVQNLAPAPPLEGSEASRSEQPPEVQSLKEATAHDSRTSQPVPESVQAVVVLETALTPTSSTGASADALAQPPTNSDTPAAEETSAMAAAVGGRPVEEPSTDADPAIATIVDSVLANLRPKIVEEISRKLGRK